jgi:hypothetical protein
MAAAAAATETVTFAFDFEGVCLFNIFIMYTKYIFKSVSAIRTVLMLLFIHNAPCKPE